MGSKIILVLAFISLVTANDLISGKIGGRRIFDEKLEASPALWKQTQNVTVNATDSETISGILITDLRPDKDGEAKILDGGEGQKNVTIELKSPTILRGFDFKIEVYVVPEPTFGNDKAVDGLKPLVAKNANPIFDQPQTPPELNLGNNKPKPSANNDEGNVKSILDQSKTVTEHSLANNKPGAKDFELHDAGTAQPIYGQQKTNLASIRTSSIPKSSEISHTSNHKAHITTENRMRYVRDTEHTSVTTKSTESSSTKSVTNVTTKPNASEDEKLNVKELTTSTTTPKSSPTTGITEKSPAPEDDHLRHARNGVLANSTAKNIEIVTPKTNHPEDPKLLNKNAPKTNPTTSEITPPAIVKELNKTQDDVHFPDLGNPKISTTVAPKKDQSTENPSSNAEKATLVPIPAAAAKDLKTHERRYIRDTSEQVDPRTNQRLPTIPIEIGKKDDKHPSLATAEMGKKKSDVKHPSQPTGIEKNVDKTVQENKDDKQITPLLPFMPTDNKEAKNSEEIFEVDDDDGEVPDQDKKEHHIQSIIHRNKDPLPVTTITAKPVVVPAAM